MISKYSSYPRARYIGFAIESHLGESPGIHVAKSSDVHEYLNMAA